MTRTHETSRSSRRKGVFAVAAALVVVVLVGLAVFVFAGQTSPDKHTERPTASSCNSSASLCDRRLNEVIFPGTHNSYAAADEPGWHFANQRYGIQRQLADGIRALLIDVHFGVYDPAKKLVRTDLRAEGSDRNKVTQQIGIGPLRIADRLAGRIGVGSLHGTPELYLCHTLCELGAEPLEQELGVIRRFLQEHPSQVIVTIVEDYVPPAIVERALEQAGLLRYLATFTRNSPLPTLGTLIARGQRLVVFAEKGGGSPSWYMPAFSYIQDTPLGARRPSQLTCARFRGQPDDPILLINNWIDIFPPQAALNRSIGRASALRQRITQCASERSMQPGIIAVDFYQQTDVVKVAAQLNDEPVKPR
jgi:hypothetical protein